MSPEPIPAADRTAHLNLSPTGTGDDAVVVDGQNLSRAVRRVLLTSEVGEPPTLVLELAPRSFVVDADGARVGVSPVGEHLLTGLGWRPPGEGRHPDVEALAEILREVLGTFTRDHPTAPSVSSGWIDRERFNDWVARLTSIVPLPDPPTT